MLKIWLIYAGNLPTLLDYTIFSILKNHIVIVSYMTLAEYNVWVTITNVCGNSQAVSVVIMQAHPAVHAVTMDIIRMRVSCI